MATAGTPYQGLDYCAGRIYGSHLSLVCYSNAADSLSDTTVYADIVQPSVSNGYAPITLDGTWTISNGTVSYLKNGAHPGWTCTGTWSVTVRGVAMVDITAGKILHFRDCTTPFTAANLKRLESDITTLVA
jgi:hypothetical protein